MDRKQIALVIGANAVISTLITLLLVVVILPALNVETPATSPTPTTAVAEEGTRTQGQAIPTAEVKTHIVQAGDTISGLSFLYDVPAEDIVAANNLANPNFLQVGTELIIPVGGVPEVTPTLSPAPTATDTPIPFEPPSADMTATAAAEAGATATSLPTEVPATGELEIEISEIIGAGEVTQERVVIANTGERLADMQGWTLSDSDGNEYEFSNFRLWGGGSVTIHTRIGQDGSPPANLYWGKLEAIWSPGETATLEDEEGETLASYVVGR